ncbi:MAG: hypothetical protein F4092_12205 [Rhodospirillaceae bacterium]|nr:hypothetical protein [Rhodospirillaceae bacterium]MYJ72506.1 hypothetical protein [Rhodospirillaceae bacterium]
MSQKIAVPERVPGFVERASLAALAMPTQRRLTVLTAPGGFGKTTLLAECCRRLREEGVPTAWISVDEQDDPDVLDTYIAYACQSAAGAVAGRQGLADPGAAGGTAENCTGLALREIAGFGGPFVLAIDELERIGNPDSVALLDFLLQRGPDNLHLAFACRMLPGGVNISAAVLEGRARIVSANELRFTRSETSEFFRGKLSRSRLTALMSESMGWPFALRVSRNEMESGKPKDPYASRAFMENWFESRLFARLGAADREFLLDIGLFEWMDVSLLDEVLERRDSGRRIDALSVLAGLIEPVRDGGTDSWRLHPLIREQCARRRFLETPERFRTVHRRIADALARRGDTVAAMRHAVEAGEPDLAGGILDRAGGVYLMLRDGRVRLQAADRWLGEAVIEARPQLALVRCASLVLSGRLEEARERYRSACPAAGLDADEDDAAFASAAADCVVRGMIVLYGGERLDSELTRTQLADLGRLAESPRVDALTRGYAEYGLCMAANMTGDLGAVGRHAARARQCFERNPYMTMYVDIQLGQAAMARGRAEDAEVHYRQARQIATRNYVVDAVPAAVCEVLQHELDLERGGCGGSGSPARIPGALVTGGTPFSAYAAACAGVLELKLGRDGADGALAAAGEMLDYVRRARLPALADYLSALRVSLLAIAGRIGEGEEAWASAGLPADGPDPSRRWWRETEALWCARLRLAIGHGRYEEARGLARGLRGFATERGLGRTLMRALALSMVLERRAGEGAAARQQLEAYLRAWRDAPYAGPLLRERAECRPLVAAYLTSRSRSPLGEAARSLMAAMERADDPRRPVLSAREIEVLRRLAGGRRDKQIAAELGLSPHGVRHHLRKLFAKLDARSRAEAVCRAKEAGLLTGGS